MRRWRARWQKGAERCPALGPSRRQRRIAYIRGKNTTVGGLDAFFFSHGAWWRGGAAGRPAAAALEALQERCCGPSKQGRVTGLCGKLRARTCKNGGQAGES